MSPSTKPSENSGICLVQYWFYTQSIYQRWRWTIDIFRIKGFGNILSHAPRKPPRELLYQDKKTMKKRRHGVQKTEAPSQAKVKESQGQCGEKFCTTEESSQSRPEQEERGFGREHPTEKEKSDSFPWCPCPRWEEFHDSVGKTEADLEKGSWKTKRKHK